MIIYTCKKCGYSNGASQGDNNENNNNNNGRLRYETYVNVELDSVTFPGSNFREVMVVFSTPETEYVYGRTDELVQVDVETRDKNVVSYFSDIRTPLESRRFKLTLESVDG